MEGSCDWAKGAPNGVKEPASCSGSWAGSSWADDTLASGAVALRPSSGAFASLLTAPHLPSASARMLMVFQT